MRLDVVDVCGRCESSFLHALLAVRVLKDEALSKLLPSAAVSALSGRPFDGPSSRFTELLRLFGLNRVALDSRFSMPSAVPVSSRRGGMATRIAANREKRHQDSK